MSKEAQLACFSKLANDETPCIIIAKGYECPEILKNIASKRNFPILKQSRQQDVFLLILQGLWMKH